MSVILLVEDNKDRRLNIQGPDRTFFMGASSPIYSYPCLYMYYPCKDMANTFPVANDNSEVVITWT